MTAPLLSVIIPTAGRRESLPRAIDSALAGAPPDVIEVLVVPNGPDATWRDVAAHYVDRGAVRFLPYATAQACAARNHGLAAARGRYVRFLDDDDYLFPAALRQCDRLEALQADVCSGAVDIVDAHGTRRAVWSQPDVADLVVATLGPWRVTATTAHVYRRAALRDLCWDECLPVRQDTDWMLRLIAGPELRWVRCAEAVGAWVQHTGPRLSRGSDPGPAALRHTAALILAAATHLDAEHRLGSARREAAADGLWSALQKGLMYAPRDWVGVARHARELAPGRRPPSWLQTRRWLATIDPLAIEFALLPLRWMWWVGRHLRTPRRGT